MLFIHIKDQELGLGYWKKTAYDVRTFNFKGDISKTVRPIVPKFVLRHYVGASTLYQAKLTLYSPFKRTLTSTFPAFDMELSFINWPSFFSIYILLSKTCLQVFISNAKHAKNSPLGILIVGSNFMCRMALVVSLMCINHINWWFIQLNTSGRSPLFCGIVQTSCVGQNYCLIFVRTSSLTTTVMRGSLLIYSVHVGIFFEFVKSSDFLFQTAFPDR